MPPTARHRWSETNEGLAVGSILLIALAVAVYLAWLVLRPFLDVIAWSLVLTVIFWPVHRRLRRGIRSPTLAALVSTLLLLLVLVLPTALLVSAVVNEARGMAANQQGSLQAWLDPAHPATGRAVRWIERYVSLDPLRSPRLIAETIERGGGELASQTLSVVGGAVGAIVRIALVMFTAFFLFRDGDRLRTRAGRLPLMRRPEIHRIVRRTRDVVEASVLGTLAVAGLQGALGGLAFLVLGLPSPVLWGTVMALLSIVPTLGAFLVWIPAAVVLAVSGSWMKALLLTAWGSLVIGLSDNILRPALVGNRAQLHELVVFFGVLGGLEVFGVLGVVLGPVVLASLPALTSSLKRIALRARTASDPPLVTTG